MLVAEFEVRGSSALEPVIFTTRGSGAADEDALCGHTEENHILLLGEVPFEHIDIKFIDALEQISSS